MINLIDERTRKLEDCTSNGSKIRQKLRSKLNNKAGQAKAKNMYFFLDRKNNRNFFPTDEMRPKSNNCVHSRGPMNKEMWTFNLSACT